MCDTGHRNNAPPNKPIRRWTPRSARTIAIAIASGSSPRQHLCRYYPRKAAGSIPEHFESKKVKDEDPRDPSSFAQLFSDTPSIRNFCSSASESSQHECASQQSTRKVTGSISDHVELERLKDRSTRDFYNDIARKLDPLLQTISLTSDPAPASVALPGNPLAASIILKTIHTLLNDLPHGTPAQWVYANDFIETGCAFPDMNGDAPSDDRWNVWLTILDKLDDFSANRLLAKVARAVALRTKLEDDLGEAKKSAGMQNSSSEKGAPPLAKLLAGGLGCPPSLAVWVGALATSLSCRAYELTCVCV